MTRTIITGVDGSETAARAAQRAAELADALGVRLHVLTAYDDFEMTRIDSGSDQFVYTTEAAAAATAASAMTALVAEFPGLEITSAAMEGKPGEVLVTAAERLEAEVIVVGNKRVQGIVRVLGSIARDVAAHASCDVYVVHTRHG